MGHITLGLKGCETGAKKNIELSPLSELRPAGWLAPVFPVRRLTLTLGYTLNTNTNSSAYTLNTNTNSSAYTLNINSCTGVWSCLLEILTPGLP